MDQHISVVIFLDTRVTERLGRGGKDGRLGLISQTQFVTTMKKYFPNLWSQIRVLADAFSRIMILIVTSIFVMYENIKIYVDFF